jgi:hypothetical protein
MNLPKIRTADIIEQEADRELLIYDLRNNKAYTLNETSKIIYRACGSQTFEDLKKEHQFTDDLIHFALDGLAAGNLIEDYTGNHFGTLSRREVVKKVGLATMVALPVIIGLTAPKAVHAASRNCVNRGGAAAGIRVSATDTNPTNDTTQNQNAIAPQLTAQCCSNSYRDFISNGCSDGRGSTCTASATCL